jgi:histone deacetylase 1/2
MDFEFQYSQKNKTLILIFPPPDHKLMSCKWIFKIKYNANGSMARHKVCLVANEFTQVEGIDFNETFSPIA